LTPPTPKPRSRMAIGMVAVAIATIGAPTAQADDAEIQALKQQVQQLQQKIDELAARQTNAPGPAPTAAAATGIIPGSTVSAAVSSAASTPGFYAGPVKMTLSGFVELMGIDRNRNEADDWASNFNTAVPFPNSHNYDLSEFHLTERQSRIAALAEGPSDGTQHIEAYVETDFGGSTTNGNNNQSSSFSPRVRHFYADYQSLSGDWYLLFGQTWSFVTAEKSGMLPRQENIPLTIDGQYVPGFDWLRVPQIRLVKNFGDALSVGISAENPAAQVSATTTAPATANLDNNSYYSMPGASNAYASTTNVTTDYLPDLVAKAALDPGWGHYELFGLTRWFRSRYTVTGEQDNQVSHAYGMGGNTLLPLIPKLLEFQASFLTGTGIGRYGSTGEPDATINPTTGALQPLHGYHALAGLLLHPAPSWTVFAYGGIEHVSDRTFDVAQLVAGAPVTYGYGYGNPLFSNAGCETEGVGTCTANTSSITSGTLGSWWKFYEGALGNMQLGVTDTYLRRSIFAGVGGEPTANMNIAEVSFRYYPYQK
jgi:hypothetical protein